MIVKSTCIRVLLPIVILAGFSLSQITEAGDETQVNATSTLSQQNPSAAMESNGDFIIVWEHNSGLDVTGYEIYARRYNADGTAKDTEFQVNSSVTGDQRFPSIASDTDGNFIVVWMSRTSITGGWEIAGQRFDDAGNTVGGELVIQDDSTGHQKQPSVAMAPDGGFTLTWMRTTANGHTSSIQARQYSSSDIAGSSFQVNSSLAENPADPHIAMDGSGNFNIVWQTEDLIGTGLAISCQRYLSDGTAVGGETTVNSTTADNQQEPSIAMDSAGNYVVSWTSFDQDDFAGGIVAQRFSAAGSPLGSEFNVSSAASVSQDHSDVNCTSEGSFSISWDSYDQDGSRSGVYLQAYASDGTPIGPEKQVNTRITDFQQFPAIVRANDDQDYVICWQDGLRNSSDSHDGSNYGIFFQRFTQAGLVVVPISGLQTDENGMTASFDIIPITAPQFSVSIPLSSSDTSEGTVPAFVVLPAGSTDPVAVTISAVDDFVLDGDIAYTIITGDPSSSDPNYDSLTASQIEDVSVTNLDNEIPAPEIDIQRPSGTSIADNGSDDAGERLNGLVNLQYTVDNTAGSADLNLSSVSADNFLNTADFTVITSLPLVIGPGNSDVLEISFFIQNYGTFSFDLSIGNDDPDESTYAFQVYGMGLAPHIEIAGNENLIPDGSGTPLETNFTDFGSAVVSDGYTDHLFYINNSGNSPLTLSGNPRVAVSGSSADEFIVTVQPDSPISADEPDRVSGRSNDRESTTFNIRFDPDGGGLRSALVTIENDDPDGSPYTFSIQGNGLEPEMDITGNGQSIINGDDTPGIDDHTHFGSANVGSGTLERTFTILNSGTSDLNLTGSPLVELTGDHADDFTVISFPSTPVNEGRALDENRSNMNANTVSSLARNQNSLRNLSDGDLPEDIGRGSTTFIIEFDPSDLGLRTAIVSIENDDSDENPYVFHIQGVGGGAEPEMDIQGLGRSITDGDTTPASRDNTDFDWVLVNGGYVDHEFTIINTGPEDLVVSPGTIYGQHPADYSVVIQPDSPVSANGGTTTFTIRFHPTTLGIRWAGVSFANTDSNENPYNFSLGGGGAEPDMAVFGNGSLIPDGSEIPAADDDTDFGDIPTSGGFTDHVFTITNTGYIPLNLSGDPLVAITGDDAAEFSVTVDPESPVGPDRETTTFTLRFDPQNSGLKSATVVIENDDPDASPYTFAIQGTGIEPDMLLQGNGQIIENGDDTPNMDDDTYFGSVGIDSGTSEHTFTILNNGTVELNLTGSPLVELSGPDAADFTVTSFPSTPVSEDRNLSRGRSNGGRGSTSFSIQFDPSQIGMRQAVVSIENDDPDDDPFVFHIQGAGGSEPEIDIKGLGRTISDGDTSPSSRDNTDFDWVLIDGGYSDHEFIIYNTGSADLIVSPGIVSGQHASDYTILSQPDSPVAANGGSTSFTVRFDPSDTGIRWGALSFSNSDLDENPYNFSVAGGGMISDDDSDGVPDEFDNCPGITNPDQDDNDNDGSGDPCDLCIGNDSSGDVDADGYCADSECDDNDPDNYPGNAELCDGQDNDCDTVIDEALGLDNDTDGHYDPGSCLTDETISGPVDDCDDADENNYPGNTESCDNLDNDCDTVIDEALGLDSDADGHYDPDSCTTDETVSGPFDDCNDGSEEAYPGHAETCDAIDNDCDNWVDEGFGIDADNDGHYDPASCMTDNSADGPYDDCDDNDPQIYTGSAPLDDPESCMKDSDNDDFGDINPPAGVVPGTDCDDSDSLKNPGAYDDYCNGIDQNCDGIQGESPGDVDNDMLDWCDEVLIYFTDPTNPDTDGDEVLDGVEILVYLNYIDPLDPDTDDDGLLDGEEIYDYNTSPFDPDTDNDLLLDGEEILTYGTNPIDADTDNDGLLDGAEVFTHNTLPNDVDTDDDFLQDGTELGVTHGHYTDTHLFVFTPDADAGATTTDPNNPDTDFGGVNDGYEDINLNGAIDAGELDPNNPNDDALLADEDGDGVGALAGDCDDNDDEIYPGAPELCDGKDNDCDGEIDLDDDDDGVSCLDDCDDDDENNFPGNVEFCDGADNDCDTQIDEDLGTENIECGFGECLSQGIRTCSNGQWFINCIPGDPADEICDGLDNDCDGNTDEDLGVFPTDCGEGECFSSGTLECLQGGWIDSCVPGTPQDETCDGLDNNCNGIPDDGLAEVLLECGVGECLAQGLRSCIGGTWEEDCTPGLPSDEICDGLDNDCDADIDEDLALVPTVCGVGECIASGTASCVAGNWNDDCTPGVPSEELCDGLDNDCNAIADDIPQQEITCGIGACTETGFRTCYETEWIEDCTPGEPGSEECDGIDNDCNGDVDEDLPIQETECGLGECFASGLASCVNGSWLDDCVPGNPSEELCDGLDNNCDGIADDGLAIDCNGDCGGFAVENICGCVGGNTGLSLNYCYGCMDEEALNFNPDAIIESGNCLYTGDCNEDGVIDVSDIVRMIFMILYPEDQ